MKVSELIEQLQNLNQDAPVFVRGYYDADDISEVDIIEEIGVKFHWRNDGLCWYSRAFDGERTFGYEIT